MVECEEFVPAVLRLMEARNEDARFQGCAVVSCQDIFLDIFSGCNVSLSLALFAPRSAALSDSAVPCLSLLCWSLLSVVSYSCLVPSLLFVCLSELCAV